MASSHSSGQWTDLIELQHADLIDAQWLMVGAFQSAASIVVEIPLSAKHCKLQCHAQMCAEDASLSRRAQRSS